MKSKIKNIIRAFSGEESRNPCETYMKYILLEKELYKELNGCQKLKLIECEKNWWLYFMSGYIS
ncbi:MAG: hypothetical protein J6K39_04440 [Clostridia bacterium]|nr:hypothetical protein [Clostridia bacterium]